MTYLDLIAEMRSARAELQTALDGWLPADVWSDEGWTIHDLIGHLAAHDREVLAVLQAWHEVRQSYTPEGWSGNVDQWNARARVRRLGLDYAQVRMDFLMVRHEVEDMIRGPYHEDEALYGPISLSWDTATTPAAFVREHCVVHEREHAEMLRVARDQAGSGNEEAR